MHCPKCGAERGTDLSPCPSCHWNPQTGEYFKFDIFNTQEDKREDIAWKSLTDQQKEKYQNLYSDPDIEIEFKVLLEERYGKYNLTLKGKHPRTWSDLIEKYGHIDTGVSLEFMKKNETIARHMSAAYKIYRLIDECYGGFVSEDEWREDPSKFYVIDYHIIEPPKFTITTLAGDVTKSFVAFRTAEDAEEFSRHKENIELLNEFYMIYGKF